MAGKHVGSAAYQSDLSHPNPSPYRKENRAWAEGHTGSAPTPANGDTVGAAAYTAGAGSAISHEARGRNQINIGAWHQDVAEAAESTTVTNFESGGFGKTTGDLESRFGLIFDASLLNEGQTVSSAVITFNWGAVTIGNVDWYCQIKSVNSASPADFATTTNPPSAATLRGTGFAVLPEPSGTGLQAVDITSVINSILQFSGWDAGNKRIALVSDFSGMGDTTGDPNILTHANATPTLVVVP